jgi:hypothetical protein
MRNQCLSEKTIAEHSRGLVKFQKIGGDLKWSENEIVDFIKEHYNVGSERKIISSTISKYRHYKGKPNDIVRDFLRQANAEASLLQREKNDKLKETLPSVDFNKLLNGYYRDKQYKNFVILYLLLNYNTRNKDLVVRVTNDQADLNPNENFIFIRDKDVIYIRNDYKTKDTYGMKQDVIKSKKVFNAVQELDSLLLDNNNLDRQVKTVTGGINQSTMFKMLVASNNNLKGIQKASKNRGTNMETIAKSYDIT